MTSEDNKPFYTVIKIILSLMAASVSLQGYVSGMVFTGFWISILSTFMSFLWGSVIFLGVYSLLSSAWDDDSEKKLGEKKDLNQEVHLDYNPEEYEKVSVYHDGHFERMLREK